MGTCVILQWGSVDHFLLNLKKAKKNQGSLAIRDGIHSATEDTNLHNITILQLLPSLMPVWGVEHVELIVNQ